MCSVVISNVATRLALAGIFKILRRHPVGILLLSGCWVAIWLLLDIVTGNGVPGKLVLIPCTVILTATYLSVDGDRLHEHTSSVVTIA
jgi:hypothetical protein